MSGNILGAVVGAGLAVATGGFSVAAGIAVGGLVGGILMPPPGPEGPRLQDRKVQASEYGRPIPKVYGTDGQQGNIIWAAEELIEVEEDSGGGKGGSESTVYSYYANFAVAICEGGENKRLGRIWAGPEKRLVYDGELLEGDGEIRFYNGSETQLPDPLIEAAMGVGMTPAYRGLAYVVLEMFPVIKDGNRIPFLTIEIGDVAVESCPVGAEFGDTGKTLYDPPPVKLATIPDSDDGAVLVNANTGRAQAFAEGDYLYAVREYQDVGYLDRIHLDTGAVESLNLGAVTSSALIMARDAEGGTVAIMAPVATEALIINYRTMVVIANVTHDYDKGDVTFSGGEYRYANYQTEFIGGVLPHGDNWGWTGIRFNPRFLPAGPDRILVEYSEEPSDVTWEAYDPIYDRMISFVDQKIYDFATEETIDVDVGITTPSNAIWDEVNERFWVNSGTAIRGYRPENISADGFIPDDCPLFHTNSDQVYADGTDIKIRTTVMAVPMPAERQGNVGVINQVPFEGSSDLALAPIDGDSFSANPVTLASIVLDLSLCAGLTEEQIDVTDLEEDLVDGYTVGKQMPVRDAVAELRKAWFFDPAEVEGKVRFVKRGGAIAMEIPDADIGAFEAGTEPSGELDTTRRMEVELPRRVTVNYISRATSYSVASKHQQRLVGASGEETAMECNIVMTDTKAQEVADVTLHGAWVERIPYEFTLPRKYARLIPTNIVGVHGYTMRIVDITDNDGIRKIKAVHDDSNIYVPHVVVTETPPLPNEVEVVSHVEWELA